MEEEDDENADGDDEVNLEDPAEDVQDAEEGKKPNEAKESQSTKLGGHTHDETAEDTVVEPVAKYDYSLLDMICQFLYEDEDPLPILCGYFLKIMEQMLDKIKLPTLEYLLLHQKGKIFNGLLRHLDQHSLTTLMIKLIEQQIQPEKKDKWEASENSDPEADEAAEPELTAQQRQMQNVLKEKATMVVMSLIDKLSFKNKNNLHMALNASTALNEFCENESFF